MIASANEQLENLQVKKLSTENRRQMIEEYMDIEKLNREIVDNLIDHIAIGKRDPVTKFVPVEIHWNF